MIINGWWISFPLYLNNMKEILDERRMVTIIGTGDIAGALTKNLHEDWIYFASGVSNSGETRESEFKRERDLLLSQDKTKHIVYFGSLCIFYNDSKYTEHKKNMEMLIKENFPHYTIFRLGNITWGTNPHTIINYFRNELANNRPINIQDVYRFVVDKDEFDYWLGLIPEWSCEMNIPGRRMKVIDIVKEFVYKE